MRGDKGDVINSWDSGAADTEVYVSSSEHQRRPHVQNERTGLPPRHCLLCAMDSDNRDFVLLAMQLRDRAAKHEHQAKAKNEFAEDFCSHLFNFLSLVWPSVTSRH